MSKITFPNKSSILYNFNSESFVGVDSIESEKVKEIRKMIIDYAKEKCNFEWKCYTTDMIFLKHLADKYDLKINYIGENVGEGYVSDGKNLNVFRKGSSVDEDYMLVTLFKEDYNYE